MNKTAVSIVPILVLLLLATFMFEVANSALTYPVPTGPLTPPTITVESPARTTYVSWYVPLQFSVNGSWDGFVNHLSVEITVDQKSRQVIFAPPFPIKWISKDFSMTLGPLSEGPHTLDIIATVGGTYRTGTNTTVLGVGDFTSRSSVDFTVNTLGQAEITISSPQNKTYNFNKDIPVTFTVNHNQSIVKMGFTLDQQSNVTIPRNTTLYGPISDGLHTLKVYSIFSDILPVYSTISFIVDTTPPNVSLLSMQEEKYNESEIPLIFTVNETTSIITYLLDGKVHTIDGNTTMSVLQDGNHELKLYATDEVGNAGSTDTIDFNVKVTVPLNVALGFLPPLVIVLGGGLGILIYLKIRKRSKPTNN
jgi:hypothetical protein